MKRCSLVIGIVVAMIVAMAGPALAFSDVAEDADYATDFAVLEQVGVYQGYPDGTAHPDSLITRAEFAAVVVRMLDKEGVAESVATYATGFSDDAAIADWARGYIIVASSVGIVDGYPDGSFRPASNVTYAEALAMLTRMLKLDEAATGSWPTNYLVLGADIGLTEGVDPIANLPITRGEMATMSVNALFSTWYWDSDEEELVEGSAEDCLLYDLDDDVWAEYGETTVAGVYEDYLASSQRIKVGGEYYYLAMKSGDFEGTIVLNDLETYAYDPDDADPGDTPTDAFATAGLDEDDDVVLTLNSDDEVTDIEITRDTYKDTYLLYAETDDDETLFGDVGVDIGFGTPQNLVVDDDTLVLLDREEVTLAELEEAEDEFTDTYDDAWPIVRVRTKGDVVGEDEYAIYVSVVTSNTVEGEVTAVGNDGDPYVRIDGEKVYYKDEFFFIPADFDVGDTVTLLMNEDDVAMELLEVVADEEDFFAKVVEYTLDDGDLDTVTVEQADGTQLTLTKFPDGALMGVTDPTTALGEVLEVRINSSGEATFHGEMWMNMGAAGAFTDYSSTWIEVDGTKYVLETDLFVYDRDADEFIGLDDLSDDPGDNVRLYTIDGVVGYVVADNAAPSAPTGLAYQVSNDIGTEYQLSWDANPESDVSHYVVDVNGAFFGEHGGSAATFVTFLTTTVGTTYTVDVTAVDYAGNESTPSTMTFTAEDPSPPAVLNLTVFPGTSAGEVDVSFDVPATDITQYYIEWCHLVSGSWVCNDVWETATTSIVGDEESYTISGLTSGDEYFFHVQAYDGNTLGGTETRSVIVP